MNNTNHLLSYKLVASSSIGPCNIYKGNAVKQAKKSFHKIISDFKVNCIGEQLLECSLFSKGMYTSCQEIWIPAAIFFHFIAVLKILYDNISTGCKQITLLCNNQQSLGALNGCSAQIDHLQIYN